MLNWNDYRYLLAVESSGSLAAAARMLGVSQPTVGRRLSVLSSDLGVELLDVFPDGARLSDAGQRICKQARVLEQQAALIELSAREGKGEQVTRVRVAASEGFAHVALVRLLAMFQARNPNVHFDLISSSRMSDLRHSEADIAVRVGDSSDENLLGRAVGQINFGLYAHESYLANEGEPTTIDDLNAHSIIESIGEIANLPQSKLLKEYAPNAKAIFSSNSSLNQIDAMLCGLGILMLPVYRGRQLSGVRRVLSQEFHLRTDLWLLYRPDARNRFGIQNTIDHLSREIPRAIKNINT